MSRGPLQELGVLGAAKRSRLADVFLVALKEKDSQRIDSSRIHFLPKLRNIFEPCPPGNEETVEQLVSGQGFRIEKIVSRGHSSPAGFWFDQPESEFVVLLSGSAKIRFESTDELVEMKPGDSMEIPAHVRHRVEWTDPDRESVWLAAFYPRT